MIKKKILAGVFSLLALSAVIGANLASAASGDTGSATSVEQQATGNSGPGTESNEANESEAANEAGGAEASEGAEAAEGAETDTHEDVGENADHQCPPDCDTAAGETP